MKFDDARKLHQKKHRELLGHFLVEGEHLVLELQRAARHNPALLGSTLFVTPAHADWASPLDKQVISDRQMTRLSETRNPQGLVAVVPLLPAAAPTEGERAVYLHEVQDPGNLGSVLRTLAWFGGFRCLLGPGSVDPGNGKVVRASMGAIFHVPFETGVAPEALVTRYQRIACLDLQGDPLSSGEFRGQQCFVFGNEARGLPRGVVSRLGARPFSIPGCGAIESLNLAAVAGMCLYELNRPA
jgi:TrmH family RNA methyltransferase